MIYLRDYIKPENILFFNEQENKDSILEKMIGHLENSPLIIDKKQFRKAVFERESLMSTGIGLGIAIPHVKIRAVKDITICIGICKHGVEWNSLDGDPVHLVFLMAAHDDQHDIYLRLLSKIILVLRKQERREKLQIAETPEAVMSHFQEL